MPLRTKTYAFEAEIDRLESRLQQIAEEATSLSDDSSRKQELLREGQQLDAQLAGVRWASTAHDDADVPVWDVDVDSVELGGLTGGEFGRIEDTITSNEEASGGATRVHLVAAGTEKAPYVDSDQSRNDTIAAVASLPLPYLKWAEARINDLTGVGESGNGKRFGDWLKAARTEATSTGN